MPDLHQDLNLIAPVINTVAAAGKQAKVRQFVVAITASSARTNLTTLDPDLAAGGEHAGQYFDFTAEGGNVYLFFNNADAGTADNTATGAGVTVCGGVVFNGQTKTWIIPEGYTWMVAIASVACNLRVALSSTPGGRGIGDNNGDL